MLMSGQANRNAAGNASWRLILSIGIALLSACSGQQDLQRGQEIVAANCKVCHAQGINGAPIIGNQKMWRSRIEKGQEALVANAINGYGLMPAKGGKSQLSDDEIKLAVAYFISQVND